MLNGVWTGDFALTTAFFAFGCYSEDYYDSESESFLPFLGWTLAIFLDFWACTLGVGAYYDSSSESCFFLLFFAFNAGDFDLAFCFGISEDYESDSGSFAFFLGTTAFWRGDFAFTFFFGGSELSSSSSDSGGGWAFFFGTIAFWTGDLAFWTGDLTFWRGDLAFKFFFGFSSSELSISSDDD